MEKMEFGSQAWLDEVFTYHAPSEEQRAAYAYVRREAKNLVLAILTATPRCADQSAAIRLVREAVMTANTAIALNGLV